DVGEPSIAVQTLDRLRSSGLTTPLLIVSGYQPAWAGLVAVDLPGVVVVPLPITRSALLDGIDLLVSRSTAEPGRHDPDPALPDQQPVDRAQVDQAQVEQVPVDPIQPDRSPADAVKLDPARPDHAFETVLLGAVPSQEVSIETVTTEAVTTTDPGSASAEDLPAEERHSEDGEAGEPPDLIRPFIQPVVVDAGGWSEPGFEWWNQDPPRARPAEPPREVSRPRIEPAAGPEDEPSTRPLRRGWPPPSESATAVLPLERESSQEGAYPEDADSEDADSGLSDDPHPVDESLRLGTGSGISLALRSAIEAAIQAHRSPGTRTPAPKPDPGPQPGPEPLDRPGSGPAQLRASDELMAHRRALLGRSPDSGAVSALRRRLGGRAYETSLGPGGTSAELIALGLHLDDADAADDADTAHVAAPPGLADPAELPAENPVQNPEVLADVGAVNQREEPVEPQDTDPPEEWTQAPDQPPSLRQIAAETARAAAPSPAERQIAQRLVLQITERVGDMFGVAETAQLLAEDLLDRAAADASAVLVPDGAVWRVSGGIGLRVLERRLVLDATHWLIEQVARGGRTLSVQDADSGDAEQRMAGAPLATYRHLIAVPVPRVEAVVLLARGPESAPFSQEQFRMLDDRADEAGSLLHDALQIRHLARLMDPLREVDPPTR
ncbi:MAG TPA: hypothetical protein VHN80_28635, partial [Kineosporiaceae bacterium]|nr:hypothetical protein [Kineosporiaceae bacterium]